MIGTLLVLGCVYILISSQMMLWGNTEHLKAEEIWLAKMWSVVSAALILLSLGLAALSIRR